MMAAIMVQMVFCCHHASLEIEQHFKDPVCQSLPEHRGVRVVVYDHRDHELWQEEARGYGRRDQGVGAQQIGGELDRADGQNESERRTVTFSFESERIGELHWSLSGIRRIKP